MSDRTFKEKQIEALESLKSVGHLSKNPAIPLIIEIGIGVCEGKEYIGITVNNLYDLAELLRLSPHPFASADYNVDMAAMEFCDSMRLTKQRNYPRAYQLYESVIARCVFAMTAEPAPERPDILKDIKEILKNNSR